MKNFFLVLCLLTLPVTAQEGAVSAEDAIHDQIREMRAGIIAAIESRDVNRMLAYTLTNLEALAITILSPKWRADVTSVHHAWRERGANEANPQN